ncbi:MAG TPA: FadR/GntR family transcriptional regulator [Spirochaetota bacterium]|nr:FadR/GntR family transcriptional regulator [Spirochaetota bacterium]HPF05810.1 FadR/GntR family transcriptional regulator [Spirochaetota bacterium]HPJ42929.1 FadR/GntR family transcriptional regulator [Spirochaetota bacterium]HPR37495.1 FadR/GntR family transcriptional regulator [Spirochaetota bacterium]HRX47277.1 FadR/GntR family transcriptional regulator [Spirochaetota bacterium]
MFTIVNKKSLSDEIGDQIINKILSGILSPGEKLPPERNMSLQMNVNRHTLREALRKLETLGLISIRQGDGIYVRDFRESGNLELLKHILYLRKDITSDILKNILEIRRFISPEMAYKAARNRSEEESEYLKSLLKENLPVEEKDLAIHQSIARGSGNILYIFILNFFNDIFRDFGSIYFSFQENRAASEKFHKNIIKAITEKNPDSAKKIMNDILIYAESITLNYMENNDEKI